MNGWATLAEKWRGAACHLRFEVENGWHHVTARGNERRYSFSNDHARRRFMELLEATMERFGTVIGDCVAMGEPLG